MKGNGVESISNGAAGRVKRNASNARIFFGDATIVSLENTTCLCSGLTTLVMAVATTAEGAIITGVATWHDAVLEVSNRALLSLSSYTAAKNR